MKSSLKFYGNRRVITQAWDTTQERLFCCGVDSWRDWQTFEAVPQSCCKESFGGQRQSCIESSSPSLLYSQGCLNVTSNYARQHASIIGGAGIVVALLIVRMVNPFPEYFH